jgi:hypothetical protein
MFTSEQWLADFFKKCNTWKEKGNNENKRQLILKEKQ